MLSLPPPEGSITAGASGSHLGLAGATKFGCEMKPSREQAEFPSGAQHLLWELSGEDGEKIKGCFKGTAQDRGQGGQAGRSTWI